MHIHVHIHIHIHIHISSYIYICTYICTYVIYTYMYMNVRICKYIYIYMHIFIHIYIYVYQYICVQHKTTVGQARPGDAGEALCPSRRRAPPSGDGDRRAARSPQPDPAHIHICIYIYNHMYIYLSIYLTIYLSIYLSIYLYVFTCMILKAAGLARPGGEAARSSGRPLPSRRLPSRLPSRRRAPPRGEGDRSLAANGDRNPARMPHATVTGVLHL